MQGRLSPLIDGKTQAFPWKNWQDEFSLGSDIGIELMEWTLDQDRLYDNPLMTKSGRSRIVELCQKNDITINSLTGDCFMQSPFWKATSSERDKLHNDFIEVIQACSDLGITIVILPLVDNGSLENKNQEDQLVPFLLSHEDFFSHLKVKIIFESDLPPYELANFMSKFESDVFGVNYDIGNSAALGFLPKQEFIAYGQYVLNVHVKDRLRKGVTVPLGEGNADFESVFTNLAKFNYQGNYILQTARASNNDHAGKLNQYFEMCKDWVTDYGS